MEGAAVELPVMPRRGAEQWGTQPLSITLSLALYLAPLDPEIIHAGKGAGRKMPPSLKLIFAQLEPTTWAV